jgi:filamentous hemagglutinin family protein
MIKYLAPLLTTTALGFLPNITSAQTYTPSNRTPQADNSIGTIVNPTGVNNFNITGGLPRGQNLLHSFTDFSIPTGGAANFINPQQKPSIITRVTGNKFSDLNGTLNTNGANFLLINPRGVVFGPGVKLDVGKAFVTSTANGVDFVDAQGKNYNFGVNQAGDAPLLTIDPNVAFNPARLIIGGSNSGSKGIENYGTLETNNSGQYIGLIGGNVTFNGGKINAPSGRIELGGLAAPGTVGLGVEGNLLRAQFPTNVARGDVSFTNGARVSVAGSGGGDIAITARNLEILGASLVRGGIETGLGTPQAVGGDIKLDATGAIVIAGSDTTIANSVRSNSKGNGGNTTINAGSFSLRDGADIQSLTFGQGNAGNVNVKATGAVDIAGTKDGLSSGIFSYVDTGTVGNGGNITIDAGSFSLRDGAKLTASTLGTGNAGNVKVTAKDAVSLVNANIFSTVEAGGVGKGGNIEIDAGSLSLRDGAQLITSTRKASDTQPAGQGDAGNVNVKVTGAVDIAGTKDGLSSAIFSYVNTGTVGKGGNITIDAGSFSLRDGAQLESSTSRTGNAGNVTVTAKDAVSLVNASILSTVEAGGVGKGGNIAIDAGSLSLQDGAQLITITRQASDTLPAGKGDAGNVNVKVSGAVDIAGIKDGLPSGIRSLVRKGTVGKGGNIEIDAGSFSLRDGAELVASTFGTGNAGNIGIKARGDITLAGTATLVNDQPTNISKSRIVSASFGLGNAGKISINNPSGKLSLSFSDIVNAIGSKDASGISLGITINARELEMKNNSLIFSDLFGKGQAGNIDIKTTGDITISGNNKDPLKFTPFNVSEISSSTRGIGDGGKISIETPGKLSLDSSGIIGSQVDKDAQGTSKGIKINVGELNLTDFGGITSDTLGKNPGGDIEIAAKGAVNIKNSSIQAGSVKLTRTLNVPGSKDLLVSSTGEGKAGNISISSERLNLNSGDIVSISTSGSGGNITLNLSDKLLLRNNSTISTSSGENLGKDFGGGNGGGNGGNITINSPLIVALPSVNFGNDITANAYTGKGGKINITSQGLFGIQYRAKGSDFTNDITASSDFGLSGSVQINTPGTDPGKDKGELPAATNDASKQISQACSASQRDNKFYITGRGGLPPNASEPQESEALWQDAREIKTKPATTATQPPKYAPPAIGWVFQPDGRVRLIAAQTAREPTGTQAVCPNK